MGTIIRRVTEYGLDADEVFEEAVENTKKDSFRFKGMSEIINEILGYNEMSTENEQMYVLTNESKTNGAIAIYYEENLAEISKKLDSNLIILPSSIHEVIILKSNDPNIQVMGTEGLKDIVYSANAVPLEEKLSDSVYLYERDIHKLMKIA